MKTPIKSLLAVALMAAFCFVSHASAVQLYNQSFDGTGNAYASQNDTNGGGNGNFATMYDNFSLGGASNVNNVMFTGGFFNGGVGTVTAFTIQFWSNNAGMPGVSLGSFNIPGNAGQTSLGTFGGVDTFTYSANLGAGMNLAAGTYWMSIVADMGFPPQWGWSSGTGGDGTSVQDFFGARNPVGADMAFTLNGSRLAVPDSGETVLLLGGAVIALGLFRRLSNRAGATS